MIMETAYAQALYRTIQSGPGRASMTPKKAIKALYEVLVARGRAALMPRIGQAFARIAAREEVRSGTTLSIARAKDERKAKHDAKAYLSEIGVKAADISVDIDENLIGGWRLEGKERLLDASWKKQLFSIYNRSIA